MTKQQIKDALVAHILKTGRCPNWRSIGVTHETYSIGVEAFAELLKDGVIERYNRVSPKGKNMSLIRVK